MSNYKEEAYYIFQRVLESMEKVKSLEIKIVELSDMRRKLNILLDAFPIGKSDEYVIHGRRDLVSYKIELITQELSSVMKEHEAAKKVIEEFIKI